MTAAEWIAERRELEQAATEEPWLNAVVGDDTTETVAEWMATCTKEPDAPATGRLWVVYAPDQSPGVVVTSITGDGPTSPHNSAWIMDARTSLPAALNALEAVLALHCSAPLFSVDGRDCEVHGTACEDNVPVCVACIDCEGEAETYPCPTVRAITEALGVES